MRTPGRIGLMFASVLGAAAFLLAAPPSMSPASAQQREIGTLARPSSPPIVARGDDNARIEGAYVNWKLDSDGDIQLCWPNGGKCYYFSKANAHGTAHYCSGVTGNLQGLADTLRNSRSNEKVYAEFTDCYRGIPGGYWHGSLCITNNINGNVRCGYVSELKELRE